eukprot:TRINITY_DN44319_c0_g1_i1.p1 TRINITY_DN44319_c0_g1~~TRINITY_DN44319_c0_g1_i1.p1  ORF type:complete len:260 (-),score=74.72 TRINITY_DN44319_c0_g1_i1:397-1176(-)
MVVPVLELNLVSEHDFATCCNDIFVRLERLEMSVRGEHQRRANAERALENLLQAAEKQAAEDKFEDKRRSAIGIPLAMRQRLRMATTPCPRLNDVASLDHDLAPPGFLHAAPDIEAFAPSKPPDNLRKKWKAGVLAEQERVRQEDASLSSLLRHLRKDSARLVEEVDLLLPKAQAAALAEKLKHPAQAMAPEEASWEELEAQAELLAHVQQCLKGFSLNFQEKVGCSVGLAGEKAKVEECATYPRLLQHPQNRGLKVKK